MGRINSFLRKGCVCAVSLAKPSVCVCVCVVVVEPSVLTVVELMKLSDHLHVNPSSPHHHLYVTNYKVCVCVPVCV